MSSLLNFTMEAHGGSTLWKRLSVVMAGVSITGALWAFNGHSNLLKDVELEAKTMWVIFEKLPGMNFVLASRDLAQLKAKPSPIKQAISLDGTMDTTFERYSVFMQLSATKRRA
jgi:hypothetical protein